MAAGFTAAEVTVATTATKIYTGAAGTDVWIQAVQGGVPLFVGPSGVTPANGYPVRGEFHFTTPVTGNDLYAVTDHTGGVVVRTLVRTSS